MNSGLSEAAQETSRAQDTPWDFAVADRISSRRFYENYHGHHLHWLFSLHRLLRDRHRHIVWFAGDSSLDNKHWLYPTADKAGDPLTDDSYTGPALNGYEEYLRPQRCIRDVCYWLNDALAAAHSNYVAINTSVEASTLEDRVKGGLVGQDLLIRDHMQRDDVLIVSVGGNDIALRPSAKTIASVAWLNWFARASSIEQGNAFGTGHVRTLFREQLQAYIEALCAKCKPRKVLVCMIYFPSVAGTGWADPLLNLLSYGKDPSVLQSIIRMVFRECISQIRIPDTEVVPVPLFDVLDANDAQDYENRVEPSVQGGFKMGHHFATHVLVAPSADLEDVVL